MFEEKYRFDPTKIYF